MKCIMTGGLGDVGSMLYKLYKRKNYYISLFGEGMNNGAKRVLHLAAKSPPASVEQIIASNILYLQEIVKYSIEYKIEEIIFFSAVSVYGKQNSEDIAESDGFVESDIYSTSKLTGENILRESPLKVLCLRLPAIMGYRNRTNFLSRCYLKLQNNERVELLNPDRLFNNFISIENIFDFLVNFSFTDKFDVVNLASKKEMTVLEIVEMMKEELNSKSEIIINNKEQSFFNISTKKAENKYSFKPYGAKECITKWLQNRQSNERIMVV